MPEEKELIPLLITRGAILYPGCSTTLDVGRVFSINAVNKALSDNEGKIILVSQKNPNDEEITQDNIYDVGTLCNVLSVRESKGLFKVKLSSISRVRIKDVNFSKEADEPYLCDFDALGTIYSRTQEEEKQYVDRIINELQSLGATSLPPSLINRLQKGITAENLCNQLAFFFPFALEEKQHILELDDLISRLQIIEQVISEIQQVDDVESKINERVREKTEKQQKEYILREKLKATQDELNEVIGEDEESEEEAILKKIESDAYPEKIKKAIKKSLKKFKQLPTASLEYSMEKSYLDLLVDMPWSNKTVDNDDLDNAKRNCGVARV